MSFNSFAFLYFFAVVYGLYLLLERRAQNVLLLAGSYFFYAYWDWRFLSLLWISTLVDFFCARGIGASSERPSRRRRLLLGISLTVNLGILGLFKYFDFFVGSAQELAALFGARLDLPTLRIVLPIGISFYTFQTLGYTIDVYRGRQRPATDLAVFALFVCFFPQLVAGPIERASKLLPQLEAPRKIGFREISDGLWLVLYGYLLKVVIADNLAPITEAVFRNPAQSGGANAGEVVLGVYAFTFQVYGDFAGYSTIALGLAKLLGFELSRNFLLPFFAPRPAEVWRRWHVTLSFWFRDHLYQPLRRKLARSWSVTWSHSVAVLVMFAASGLWHGAAWHFVVWGILHGWVVVIAQLAKRLPWVSGRGRSPSALRRALAIGVTFNLWTWVNLLFAVRSLGDATLLLRGLGRWGMPATPAVGTFVVFVVPLVLFESYQERRGELELVERWPPLRRELARWLVLLIILLCGETGSREFIYFQF